MLGASRKLAILMSLLPGTALAQSPDDLDFFNQFINDLSLLVRRLTDSSTDLYYLGDILWAAFGLIMVLIVILKYVANSTTIHEFIYYLILIMVAKVLMDNYDSITSALWSVARELGDDINRNTFNQFGLDSSEYSTSAVFVFDLVRNLFDRVTFPGAGNLNIFSLPFQMDVAVINFLLTVVFLLSGILLYAISLVISLWGLWAFAVAKIIGYVLIPFIIIKQFNNLFDGWLNFMIASLLFFVVAQINLAISAVVLLNTFESIVIDPNSPLTLDLANAASLIGYAAMLFLAVFGLFKTESLVGSIMSGGLRGSNVLQSIATGMVMRGVR